MTVASFLTGPDYHDLGVLLLRLHLGIFFVLARFRWLYDPSTQSHWVPQERRAKLQQRLCSCGYNDHPCMCAAVALTEIFGGGALILGLFTNLALIGIGIIMLFAIVCKCPEDIREHNGEGSTSYFSWFMWNIEGAFFIMIMALLALGPGAYSVDHWLLGAS